MARTALRGEPSAFLRANHDGSAPSAAIAARSRLAATVLPTRFVKTAAKNVAAPSCDPHHVPTVRHAVEKAM